MEDKKIIDIKVEVDHSDVDKKFKDIEKSSDKLAKESKKSFDQLSKNSDRATKTMGTQLSRLLPTTTSRTKWYYNWCSCWCSNEQAIITNARYG